MTTRLSPLVPAMALVLLAGCSSGEETVPDAVETSNSTTPTDAVAEVGAPAATPDATATPAATLTLEGLGDLTIGQPVPAGSSFSSRGVPAAGSSCTTLTSSSYPGVVALTENGQVRRISVGSGSSVKLIEGVGPGSTEAQVKAAFPGFTSTPHKYLAAPAKDLTQPGNDPRLRFEIGQDGMVSQVHVGLIPQLGYVEGCG